MRTRNPELWKGVVAGAAAGLVASWIMNQFQAGWGKIQQRVRETEHPGRLEQQQTPEEQPQSGEQQSEDATMKTADAVARTVFRKELNAEQKQRLSPVVHYTFGTLMGAVYGGLAEEYAPATSGWGTAFGSALFVGADEIAVPLFGLSQNPTKSSLNTHLYAWASHAVYGAALESVRRPVRIAMGYNDLGSKISHAQDAVGDSYERAQKFVQRARKQARSTWKSGMKTVEKTARKMRKAA